MNDLTPEEMGTVKKVTGPTIPRWKLGSALKYLRTTAGYIPEDARDALGCSLSKIHKIEAGTQSIALAELEKLLDLYEFTDKEEREELLELQRLGKRRGWWARFGGVPEVPSPHLFGIEEGAEAISAYETCFVHGLLQTEDYARALIQEIRPDLPRAETEKTVETKMFRQKQVFETNPPTTRFIFDEAALRRRVGNTEITNKQLERLLDETETHRVQIIPFTSGAHPGMFGAFTIFEYNDELHSPVVYAEGQAGDIFMEKRSDTDRCFLFFDHMTALALNPSDSRKIIESCLIKTKAEDK